MLKNTPPPFLWQAVFCCKYRRFPAQSKAFPELGEGKATQPAKFTGWVFLSREMPVLIALSYLAEVDGLGLVIEDF